MINILLEYLLVVLSISVLIFYGIISSPTIITVTQSVRANAASIEETSLDSGGTNNSTNLTSIGSLLNSTTAVTNKTITIGPPQEIQSKQLPNNATNKTITIGPPRVIESKPTGNYTNGTMSATTSTVDVTNNQQSVVEPITKEQALKSEQQANVMIKAYNEKVEKEKREQAAALAAAQANQTGQTTDGIEESEDGTTAAPDEMETEPEEEEDQDDDDEGDENGNNEEE